MIIIRRGRAHPNLPPFSERDGTTMSALYPRRNTRSAHKSCTALCTYLHVAVICTVMVHWYTRGLRRDNCCSPTLSGAAQASRPVYQTTLSAAVIVGKSRARGARHDARYARWHRECLTCGVFVAAPSTRRVIGDGTRLCWSTPDSLVRGTVTSEPWSRKAKHERVPSDD